MNRYTTLPKSVTRLSLTLLFILASGLFTVGTLSATPLGLVDVPMDVQEGVPPNILLTVDDSGSMSWYYLPDTANGSQDYIRGAASAYNKIYYDPTIRYVPGVYADGSTMGSSDFTAAWGNGYDHSWCGGNTVDLRSGYKVAWTAANNDCSGSTVSAPTSVNGTAYTWTGAAYYYVYNASHAGCSGSTSDNSCYDAVVIDPNFTSYVGGPGRTDCANPMSCTYDEEKQNFANWYTYYRSRQLLAKTAAGRAFAQITGNVRAAHQTINGDKTISSFSTFAGTARQQFFNWLYGIPETNDSTPLRIAFINGGKEFTKSGIDSPYATEPGVVDAGITGKEYSCRQNFQVLLTDGYWNGGDPTTPALTDNNTDSNYDNSDHNLPNASLGVSAYTARPPYKDGNSKYLADYALYYWATDLRADTGMTNNVPTYIQDSTSDYDGNGSVNDADRFWNPVNDPANWQHMVSFTIGLGIDGNRSPSDYPNLISGTQSWGSDHVDDLWHAAINGRGQYFSAKNPTQLVDAFSGVLNAISQRIGSSSAPAPSAPRYEAGTKLYQPVYDTSDWHGDLRRYDVTNLTTPEWNAMDILNAQDFSSGRSIITYDPAAGTGIPFRWASINAAQQTQLTNNTNVLNYIRGDKSNELSNGGTYRNRTYVLGDIVNSEPVFVGPPQRLFPDTLEAAPYSAFSATYATREPMVWVGANDGMLHAFDANTGHEILAYVPSKVYDNLASLTSTSYSHKFFVDGSPTERDVFYAGAWHTVLVGGLNKGGQGIYALNITNPGTFATESGAASDVLWEFSDDNDADLGYTYSTPQVAKMNNGTWMAIFGNGYNNTENDDSKGYCTDADPATPCPVSTTGDAVLYLLNIQTGSMVKKLDTLVGTAQDPTGNNRPNGLSSVAVVDADGNYTVDYIYAGDLFGNLWKFDVTDTNPANWTVVKSVSNVPAPLFVATDADGNHQPITSAPVVGVHTSQAGFMVNFGTGKYMELGDLTDTRVQTFYGIWDRNETAINTIQRAHTQEQSVLYTNTTQFGSYNARITSDNSVNWYTGSGLPTSGGYLGWHMDLMDESSTKAGERVIAKPQRRSDRIIFVTNTPSPDPCMAGGSSWIMELNAVTGQRLNTSPFDYNHDGIVDAQDMVQANFDVNGDGVVDANDLLAGTGIQDQTGGKLSRPTILLDQNGNEVKLSSTSNASITKVVEAGDQQYTGRRSWIQLLPN